MRNQPRSGEIYLEFRQVGQQVKVTAIDAATGVEVSVFGPLSAPQEDLKRLAVRKLKRRIEQLSNDGAAQESDRNLY